MECFLERGMESCVKTEFDLSKSTAITLDANGELRMLNIEIIRLFEG